MNLIPFLAASSLLLSSALALAADVSSVPAEPIAVKKEMLFSDDFEKPEPAKQWHKVVPTFAFEKGVLKGSQTRDQNVPAGPDGKGAVQAHAAVFGLDVP